MTDAVLRMPQMTERDFQRSMIDLAHMLGWRVAHFRPAKTAKGWRTPVEADGAGWPDLILCRGDRIIAAELKAGRNKTTAQQDDWLARLAATGVEVFVWRPENLRNSNEIFEVLR